MSWRVWVEEGRIAVYVVSIIVVYGVQGVLIEASSRYGFDFPFFLSFLEVATFSLFSSVRYCRSGHGTEMLRTAPIRYYCWLGFVLCSAKVLTWAAIPRVGYVAVLFFKSSKLFIVMIASAIFLQRRYTLLQYMAAVLVVAGVTTFSLGDSSATTSTTLLGCLLITLSLFADTAVSTSQEKSLKVFGRHQDEILFVSNSVAVVPMLLITFLAGEFGAAIEAFSRNRDLIFIVFMTHVVGYLGLFVWVSTISAFSAVVATAAGLIRKTINVALSYVLFPKSVSLMHVVGFVLLSSGLYVGHREHEKKDTSSAATPQDVELGESSGR